MNIGVVCVTHNSEAVLTGLLDSLPASASTGIELRCCVVDSGSTDETLSIARSKPGVTVIDLGANLGFAAGINAGSKALADFDALCVVNPDVRLEPASISFLAETVCIPTTGIAVPRLVDASGSTRLSIRRDPSVTRAVGDAMLGGRIAGRFSRLGEMEVRPSAYLQPGIVDWATGAVMMISRDCLARVGLWDEQFFLYSEEVDYALRARAAGFCVRYDPRAVASHAEGDARRSPELASLLTINRVRCFRKHHALPHSMAFHLAVLLNELMRSRNPVSRRSARALVQRRARHERAQDQQLLRRDRR